MQKLFFRKVYFSWKLKIIFRIITNCKNLNKWIEVFKIDVPINLCYLLTTKPILINRCITVIIYKLKAQTVGDLVFLFSDFNKIYKKLSGIFIYSTSNCKFDVVSRIYYMILSNVWVELYLLMFEIFGKENTLIF